MTTSAITSCCVHAATTVTLLLLLTSASDSIEDSNRADNTVNFTAQQQQQKPRPLAAGNIDGDHNDRFLLQPIHNDGTIKSDKEITNSSHHISTDQNRDKESLRQIILPSFVMMEDFVNDTTIRDAIDSHEKFPGTEQSIHISNLEDKNKIHVRQEVSRHFRRKDKLKDNKEPNTFGKFQNGHLNHSDTILADLSDLHHVTPDKSEFNSVPSARTRRFRNRLRRVSNYNTIDITSVDSNDIFKDDILNLANANVTNRHSDGRARNIARHKVNNYNERYVKIVNTSKSSNYSNVNNRHNKGRSRPHNSRHFGVNKNIYQNGNIYNSNLSAATSDGIIHKSPHPSLDHLNLLGNSIISMNQSLSLFNLSVSGNRNYSLMSVVQTGPTPEILPLDDVTNTYDIVQGGGNILGTNGTRERGSPGDPRRPYFPLKQEVLDLSGISDFTGMNSDDDYENGLRCYSCSATSADQSCYKMPDDNDTLLAETPIQSKQCSRSQHFCMVSRVWFYSKNGSNRTEHPFSIERRCEEKCEPYCIMMGDRTRIEIYACRSCCNTPDCNTGNAASSTVAELQFAALLVHCAVAVMIHIAPHFR